MLSFSGSLNSQDGELEVLVIQEGVDHKVLLIVNKALSELLDNLLGGVLLIKELDVLSGGDLTLLHNTLLVPHQLSLVVVDEGVVLSDFPHHIVDLLVGSEGQECLLDVEVLLLYVSGHHNIVVGFVCDEEEFLDEGGGGGQPYELQDSLETVVDLALEALPIVLNDAEMRVAHPSIDEFLIKVLGLLDAFIPCLVILVCEKFFGTLGCSH